MGGTSFPPWTHGIFAVNDNSSRRDFVSPGFFFYGGFRGVYYYKKDLQ